MLIFRFALTFEIKGAVGSGVESKPRIDGGKINLFEGAYGTPGFLPTFDPKRGVSAAAGMNN